MASCRCFSHIFDLNSCSSTVHAMLDDDEEAESSLCDDDGIMLEAVAAMYCAAATWSTLEPVTKKMKMKVSHFKNPSKATSLPWSLGKLGGIASPTVLWALADRLFSRETTRSWRSCSERVNTPTSASQSIIT